MEKTSDPDSFYLGNSPMFKEDMMQILDKLFQKYGKGVNTPLPLLEASITLILNLQTLQEKQQQ